ncbi:MAG: hypothetical protein QW689_08260, partial [Nitrososphaerota archaeon]
MSLLKAIETLYLPGILIRQQMIMSREITPFTCSHFNGIIFLLGGSKQLIGPRSSLLDSQGLESKTRIVLERLQRSSTFIRGGRTMRRYWCISTSPENWEICKKYGIWGMDERYYVTLEKFLSDGYLAFVYVHVGKFVAVIKFVGSWFFEEKDVGWTKERKRFLYP